jgi:hypothetical protein
MSPLPVRTCLAEEIPQNLRASFLHQHRNLLFFARHTLCDLAD